MSTPERGGFVRVFFLCANSFSRMYWQQHTHLTPSGVLFHSGQGSQYGSRAFRQRLWRYHMSQQWQLLGQCTDGAAVQELEDRVAPGNGIYEPAGSEVGSQLLPDGLAAPASTQ